MSQPPPFNFIWAIPTPIDKQPANIKNWIPELFSISSDDSKADEIRDVIRWHDLGLISEHQALNLTRDILDTGYLKSKLWLPTPPAH